MHRYVVHLVVACALGFCQAEPDESPTTDEHTRCICKPTVLAQVTKQNEHLTSSSEEINQLKQSIQSKDSYIQELNDQISSANEELKKLLDPRPHDCADVQRYGFHYSGIYTIYPPTAEQGIEVFCDLNTDSGGWLVFQRRQDGSENFERTWDEYKFGFGKLAKEFWLGNDNLHELTGLRQYELRVDLTDYLGQRYYAKYDTFAVDNENNKYTLHVGEYEGDAGDALTHHNNAPFSTIDQDNDQSRSGNCAELYGGGGWWWVHCYDSNLNGLYSNRHLYETVVWYQLRKNHEPMRHVEMKIRPKRFKN
ncbi:hypothetical protein LSH36_730g01065 [Paralvinella palmiformis]|uniref:Fibrinogen C-terminal domain-containing protein n=1 Tax=Paralvinella palmiformis TaxID=53620 RepID=A0AAD9J1D1_9ANNE|nr:hypothetical protein LSH36_730g01065 [Paralvinella palmiformis]